MGENATEAGRLHAAGLEAMAAGHPARAAQRFRAALRLLGHPFGPETSERAAQAARVLISLAHAEAELGNTEAGLQLLTDAEPLAGERDRAILVSQRGLLLLRMGRYRESLPDFDAAVAVLSETEDIVLARVLLNRGVLHLHTGRVRLARQDLRRCGDIAAELGLERIAAKVKENLGYGDYLAGDIPAALASYEAAGRDYARIAPGFLPVLAVDQARVLLSVGLAKEAGDVLDPVFADFRQQRLSQDYAEAELTRARSALLTGDFGAAKTWAGRAMRRFARRGSEGWTAQAQLVRLLADYEDSRSYAVLAARSDRLAGRLRRLGLDQDAEHAELLATRALVRAGRIAEAELRRRGVRDTARRTDSLRTNLLRRLSDAEIAYHGGRRGEVFRHLRSGLSALRRYRERLGSLDLQAGVSALGVDLARLGLQTALDNRSVPLVFAWSERARAQAFRRDPVRPPDDAELAELLAELRQHDRTARLAELSGRPDPAARTRQVELERAVRARSWQLRRLGGGDADPRPPELAAVKASLASDGRAMVAYLRHRGSLLALTITRTGARLVPLGAYSVVEGTIRRLLVDLDAMAGRQLVSRLAVAISASIRGQAQALAGYVLDPLRELLGEDDGLVVVPTGALASVPWGLLPGLHDRPVTVAPSANVWLRARDGLQPGDARHGVALIAGPELPYAQGEVEGIAALYASANCLTGKDATVEATLALMAGAQTVHFAAHGHHEQENVLFSRLDLADGALMAYDIQRLPAAPRHVVLSSCEVGQSAVRAGDELLGFTAALLYAGTSSVISSVARVPDEAVSSVMQTYHRNLVRGDQPAQAIAAALGSGSFLPFVCFGAG